MPNVFNKLLLFILLIVSVNCRSFIPESIRSYFAKLTNPQAFQKYENPSYNETFATQMAFASGLGYCGVESVASWNCGAPCSKLNGFMLYFVYQAPQDKDIAYMILINPSEKQVVFTFRGTNGNQQLISQITHSKAVNYSTDYWNAANAQVLTYFRNIYKIELQATVIKNLNALGTSEYRDYQFIFTGHSLGGALATLAALDASTSEKIPVTSGSSPYLITYGSPRVGNYYFAAAVNNIIPVMFRITHSNDIVPHVPPCAGSMVITTCKAPTPKASENENSYWYGWHLRQEIWYKDVSSGYKICSESNNEDHECSNSLYISAVDPHFNYLGLPISKMCYQ